VDAREPGPLAVRLENLPRLLRLDPAAALRRDELDQTEVADEAALEAAETVEADHPRGPGAEPALPLDAPRGDLRGDTVQAL
jgi:hypothetical protein